MVLYQTNMMNQVLVVQQPQEFNPYINARTASYGDSHINCNR